LDDLKEARRYWKLQEEAQDRTFGELRLEEVTDLSQDIILLEIEQEDRLYGLVVRVPGYISRGPGFYSRHCNKF
jgi:hypothetical protein